MKAAAPREIRLPDRFYLPRPGPDGREVHDVMPWEGAVNYATDGKRVGIQFADGRVTWLGDAAGALGPDPAEEGASFAEDFADVNLDALVDGLRVYMERHPILKSVWREDMERLDTLRGHVPGGGPHPTEGEAA